jgi:hypothetical protein
METIYMLVLFFGPGLLVKAIDKYIHKTTKSPTRFYDYVFEIVAHSIVVFFAMTLCGLILNASFFPGLMIYTVHELTERMDSISFILGYIALAALLGVGWWFLFIKRIKRFLEYLRNKFLKKDGIRYTKYNSVYEMIFRNPKITMGAYIVVSIYQNNKYVTSGLMTGLNSPDYDIKEYRLEHTDEIEEILVADKEKSDNDKILFYTDFEYFNPEQNLLIKFYRPNRLERHWAKYKND